MADYIYMMESRLTPDQQRAVAVVQEAARTHEMNVYLTGGAMRDIISGFSIRDVDLTVQGNPLKLQKDLERAGAVIQGVDEELRSMHVLFAGSVRGEVSMARSEKYDKPGKPPEIAPATIIDDLRRRDFTVNAMALSLNPGSRGLLLDPANGVADIEAKLIRILHNYAFLEEPSRLIRATRFTARFHWTMDERTQARYAAAKEGEYIEHISSRAIGHEIDALAHEEDPLHIMRALDKEGWLKVLNSHWSVAKVDTAGLSQVLKLKQQLVELGYTLDAAPAVMHFLTRRLSDKDVAEMQRLIPRKEFVAAWRHLEDEAKDLAKKLTGKEAATPSRTWHLLSHTRPETILFLEVTTRHSGVAQKLRNFLGKWRQVKQKFPLPEMGEMRITPELPVYPKLVEEMFLLMLDGKLRSHTEIVKYLKPYEPPPPAPPPPPPKKARAKKTEEAPVPAPAEAAPPAEAKGKKKKGEKAAAPAAPAPAAKAGEPKAAAAKAAPGKAAPAKKAPPKKVAAKKPAPKKKPAKPAPKKKPKKR
jgi:tRNA nucleotidyltransferase/poly(A) polymerase